MEDQLLLASPNDALYIDNNLDTLEDLEEVFNRHSHQILVSEQVNINAEHLPGSVALLPSARSKIHPEFAYNQHNESVFDDERLFPSLHAPVAGNSDEIVKFDETNPDLINNATLRALLVQLTSPEVIDYNLICDFFLTYRVFVKSEQVLNLLLTRLIWALQYINSAAPANTRIGKLVLLRTFVVLRHWIINYYADDFDHDPLLCNIFVSTMNKITNESELIPSGPGDTAIFETKIICDLKTHWLSMVRQFGRLEYDELDRIVASKTMLHYELPSCALPKRLSKSGTDLSVHTNASYRRSAMLSLYDKRSLHKCIVAFSNDDENPQYSINNLLSHHTSSRTSLNYKLQAMQLNPAKTPTFDNLQFQQPRHKSSKQQKQSQSRHNHMTLKDSSLELKRWGQAKANYNKENYASTNFERSEKYKESPIIGSSQSNNLHNTLDSQSNSDMTNDTVNTHIKTASTPNTAPHTFPITANDPLSTSTTSTHSQSITGSNLNSPTNTHFNTTQNPQSNTNNSSSPNTPHVFNNTTNNNSQFNSFNTPSDSPQIRHIDSVSSLSATSQDRFRHVASPSSSVHSPTSASGGMGSSGFSTNGNIKLPTAKILVIVPPTPVKKMDYVIKGDTSSLNGSPKRTNARTSQMMEHATDFGRKKSIKKLVDGWKKIQHRTQKDKSDDLLHSITNILEETEERQVPIGTRVDVLSARIVDELEYLIRYYIKGKSVIKRDNPEVDLDVLEDADEQQDVLNDETFNFDSSPQKSVKEQDDDDESLEIHDIQDLSDLNIVKIDNLINVKNLNSSEAINKQPSLLEENDELPASDILPTPLDILEDQVVHQPAKFEVSNSVPPEGMLTQLTQLTQDEQRESIQQQYLQAEHTQQKDFETKNDFETKQNDFETKQNDFETKQNDFEINQKDSETIQKDFETNHNEIIEHIHVAEELIDAAEEHIHAAEDQLAAEQEDDHIYFARHQSVAAQDEDFEKAEISMPSPQVSPQVSHGSSFQNPPSISWNDLDLDHSNDPPEVVDDLDEFDFDYGKTDRRLVKSESSYYDVSNELAPEPQYIQYNGSSGSNESFETSVSTPSNITQYDADIADLGIALSPQSVPQSTPQMRTISFSEAAHHRVSAISRNSISSALKRDSVKSYISYDSAFSISRSSIKYEEGDQGLRKKNGFTNLRAGADSQVASLVPSASVASFVSHSSLRKSIRYSTLRALTELPFSQNEEQKVPTAAKSARSSDVADSSIFSVAMKSRINSVKHANSEHLSNTSSANSVVIPGISSYVLKELAAIPDESYQSNDPVEFAFLKLEGKESVSEMRRKEKTSKDADRTDTKTKEANTSRRINFSPTSEKHPEDLGSNLLSNVMSPNSNSTQDILNDIHNANTQDVIDYTNVDFTVENPLTPKRGLTSTPLGSIRAPKIILDNYAPSTNLLSVQNVFKSNAHISFVLSVDSDSLANHFTIIEKDMLQEIDWKELIELKWNKELTPVNSWLEIIVNENYYNNNKGVNLVIARFNLMVNWIISEILLTQSQYERICIISRFIHVAQNCFALQNFSTLMQVILALTSEKVQKLRDTWKNLPPGDILMLKNLEELSSPLKNFLNLRLCINQMKPSHGCVPFVGLYLSDLIFNAERPTFVKQKGPTLAPTLAPMAPNWAPGAHSASPSSMMSPLFTDADATTSTINSKNEPEKLINFSKFRTSVHIVKSLSQCIEWSGYYKLVPSPELLSKCLYIKSLDEDEMNYCLANLKDL